jgi:hypothetical protein
MQYIRHRVHAPITMGDCSPGLSPPSDDTHELGDDESLSCPSTSIPTGAGGDRFSCSSRLALLTPLLPLPRLMVCRTEKKTDSFSYSLSNEAEIFRLLQEQRTQTREMLYLKPGKRRRRDQGKEMMSF